LSVPDEGLSVWKDFPLTLMEKAILTIDAGFIRTTLSHCHHASRGLSILANGTTLPMWEVFVKTVMKSWSASHQRGPSRLKLMDENVARSSPGLQVKNPAKRDRVILLVLLRAMLIDIWNPTLIEVPLVWRDFYNGMQCRLDSCVKGWELVIALAFVTSLSSHCQMEVLWTTTATFSWLHFWLGDIGLAFTRHTAFSCSLILFWFLCMCQAITLWMTLVFIYLLPCPSVGDDHQLGLKEWHCRLKWAMQRV